MELKEIIEIINKEQELILPNRANGAICKSDLINSITKGFKESSLIETKEYYFSEEELKHPLVNRKIVIEEQLISFKTAKLARKKGFIYENGRTAYTEDGKNKISTRSTFFNEDKYSIIDSTQTILQRWLREKHNLHIYIDTTAVFDKMQASKYKALIKVPFQPFKWTIGHYYLGETYEEALEEGLYEALKLIK